jgi:hypothetical protein
MFEERSTIREVVPWNRSMAVRAQKFWTFGGGKGGVGKSFLTA